MIDKTTTLKAGGTCWRSRYSCQVCDRCPLGSSVGNTTLEVIGDTSSQSNNDRREQEKKEEMTSYTDVVTKERRIENGGEEKKTDGK